MLTEKKFKVGDPVLVDREKIAAEVLEWYKGGSSYCVLTQDGKIFDVYANGLEYDTTKESRYITRKLFVERIKDLYENYMQEKDWEKLGKDIPFEFLDNYSKTVAEYKITNVYYSAKAVVVGVFYSLSQQHEHIKDPVFIRLKKMAKRLISVGV